MQIQDTSKLKDKIISKIRMKGPSLPVHIAKEIETDILFASAFLSELLSEKKVKISNLKVGGSPLYFIPGQEIFLEKFSGHLRNKEKEAFEILKKRRILKDAEQPPAIRVALREIKDFAIPFKQNNEIHWKYAINPEQKTEKEQEMPLIKEVKKQFEEKEESLEIQKKNPKKETPKKELEVQKEMKKVVKKIVRAIEPPTPKKSKEKNYQKKEGTFFKKVKEYLIGKSMAILDIEGVSKNNLILKVKKNQKEELIVAYNKKRINETDIVKAHKKASAANLKYTILSFGGPLKKLSEFIEALKELEGIEKIE